MLGPTVGAADEARGPQRPNVVRILTDDQRPGTSGALGNPAVRTPYLDRLAREGTIFTRAV